MKKIIIVIGVVVLIGLIGFFSRVTEKNPDSQSMEDSNRVAVDPNTIEIKDYKYGTGSITISKGTTISWKNKDIAKHTVTIDEESIEGPKSEFFGKDEEYSYTFSNVGTFAYHCEPHPYMKGRVTVTE